MRSITFTLSSLALLAAASCSGRTEDQGQASQPIVGESARADTKHSAVVAIETDGGSLCTGTVIHRTREGDRIHILTAAHCCRESNPPKEVAVGADFASPVLSLPIDSFQQHPCYNPLSNDYDVCVVTVKDEGKLNVTPVPLASAPDALEAGSEVTAVGYGSTPASNTLRRWTEGRLGEVSTFTIALDQTGGQGGICFGDSGGPILIQQEGHEVVAGVISFGAPTSLCNVVGAAGRVTFPGVRAQFLDKVLAGEPVTVKSLMVRRRGFSLGPVRDTYLASDEPNRNFGDRVDLLVGSPNGNGATRRALVRFDLSALPAGATLLSGRLGFHQESKTGPATIEVFRVTRDWDERRETWASFGDGFDPTPVASASNATAVVTSTEELWFDVTPLVNDWVHGVTENDGILVGSAGHEQTQLISSEIGRAAERPWLQVCYQPAAR